jgi:hypothetical protein
MQHHPDLVIQNDESFYPYGSDNWDIPESCGGFFYMRNTPGIIHLVEDMRDYLALAVREGASKREHDQSTLNYLIRRRKLLIHNEVPARFQHPFDFDLVVHWLDQHAYPNGHLIFATQWPQRPVHASICEYARHQHLVLIHANSCLNKWACLKRHHLVMLDGDAQCIYPENLENRVRTSLCAVTRWFY